MLPQYSSASRYYPFNFGKPVGPFGFLGHREQTLPKPMKGADGVADVSDWERLRVRSVNGTAVSVDYSMLFLLFEGTMP